MKTFKAIGAALVLALSLSIPAYADGDPGDVHFPGHSIPAPPDPTAKPGSTITATETDDDPGFPTVADILWALASMY
jgi:hypothetical protein